MANQFTMARVQNILTLWNQGTSQRKIALLLGIDRETVSRHIRLAASNPAKAPPGRSGIDFPEPSANSPKITGRSTDRAADGTPPGTESTAGTGEAEISKPAKAPPGIFGQKSGCEPFRTIIEAKVHLRLTAQRIWQDLKVEQGFTGSYYSVRRFVRQMEAAGALPFRRMECEPGDEVQVDFGQGAPVRQANGKMRRPHVFRVVLSFSRKAYSEVVWRQDTETFLRCMENAFHAFGGVPRTVVVDNLKAAVIHPDWYDPDLNPKLASFGEYYGTVILPTRSYTPRHKGKVERQVGYVQDNGLKGRTFDDLAAENTYLAWWEANVADQRIHGTMRQQVKKVFEEQERAVLKPCPSGFFPFFQEGERSVHRDGHLEVAKAYYSVPPEYTGLKVWVRYDSKLIRIYNHRMESIAVHCRLEPGRFSTQANHLPQEKIAGVERGAAYHLRRAERIGPWSHLWARTMLKERGIPGVRVIVGFIALTHHYSDHELEKACQVAIQQGCYHLRSLRHLLKEPGETPMLAFMEHHPMIRPMKDYQNLVAFDFGPDQRARILPFPTSEPNDQKAGNVPRLDDSPHFTGDETYHGKS